MLNAPPATSTWGQSVTLTAVVSSSDGATPTGTVAFRNGTTSLGNASLQASGAGQATAMLTTSALPLGMDSVTANYIGSTVMQASSSAAAGITISQASSTTALASSASTSVYGQSVTFTATVSPGYGGTPTGTVTFSKNGAAFGTATLSGGKAVLTTSPVLFAPSGTPYAITANYNGSANLASSTATLAGGQTVNEAASTTVVVSSMPASMHGVAVTFTATVTANAPSVEVPIGSVIFYNGTVELGVSALSGGKAMLTTSTLPIGSDMITAVYAGESYITGSTSAAITQAVK
jgi:hypothetical protein